MVYGAWSEFWGSWATQRNPVSPVSRIKKEKEEKEKKNTENSTAATLLCRLRDGPRFMAHQSDIQCWSWIGPCRFPDLCGHMHSRAPKKGILEKSPIVSEWATWANGPSMWEPADLRGSALLDLSEWECQ